MDSISVRSVPSKLILFLGFVSIVITTIKDFNKQKIFAQAIIYYFIAKNADCLIYGNCGLIAWFTVLVPILGIFIFILDYLGYFEGLKTRAQYIENKINQINNIKYSYDRI